MEILKKTIKSGNASAVVLPKAWLDKRVRIELIDITNETILYDILDIIKSIIDSSEIIGILVPGVTYHYRIKATNINGTSYGEDMTFTTPAQLPIVQTLLFVK